MSESEKSPVNEDPFQSRKPLDTSRVLDEIGRKNNASPKRKPAPSRAPIVLLFLLVIALAGVTGWLGYEEWLARDRYNTIVAEVEQENARLQQSMTTMRETMQAEQSRLQTELTQQTELLRQSNTSLQQALGEMDELERSDEQRLARLQQQIGNEIEDVEGVVGALQRQVGNLQQRDTRWLTAEANYLMRLAQQKLQLESDIESTALLLRTIVTLLEGQNSTLAATARQNLADDLQALQQLRLPDRGALLLQLTALGEDMQQLSLAGSRQAGYQERVQSQWQQTPATLENESWLDAGMALLRTIFVWREWDETPAEILPPQQETILKQQLVLQLEQAQLAMLQGDQLLYQQVLGQAMNNLQRHFESDNERTRQLLNELEQLRAANLNPALPDLSATADLLRQLADSSGTGAVTDTGTGTASSTNPGNVVPE